jgi:hypothetical protein
MRATIFRSMAVATTASGTGAGFDSTFGVERVDDSSAFCFDIDGLLPR